MGIRRMLVEPKTFVEFLKESTHGELRDYRVVNPFPADTQIIGVYNTGNNAIHIEMESDEWDAKSNYDILCPQIQIIYRGIPMEVQGD